MPPRLDVPEVPPQGGYVAKRCPVRAQLDTDTAADPSRRVAPTATELARMEAGNEFEARVFAVLAASQAGCVHIPAAPEGTDWATGRAAAQRATLEALADPATTLVLGGDLPDDLHGRRTGKPDVLLRVPGGWVPLDVKHHRLTADHPSSSIPCSPLHRLRPDEAVAEPGVQFRAGRLADDAFQLAHYRRMLEHLGLAPAGEAVLGGIIDRSERLWWIDLGELRWKRWWSESRVSTLAWYDHEFQFRLDVISHTLRRNADPTLDRKVEPVWTSECGSCPWRVVCREELEAADHVSLLPRSTWDQFVEHRRRGTLTRRQVAELDRATAWLTHGGDDGKATKVDVAAALRAGTASAPETPIAALVGNRRKAAARRFAEIGIETAEHLARLDEHTASYHDAGVGHLPSLIDQARAAVAGGPHRRRGVEHVVVPRADVEIDVDMESTEGLVYLWGTFASGAEGVVLPGYRPFVTWDPPTVETQAALFAAFWQWLVSVRAAAHGRGLTFAAYCYTGAEASQMRAALDRVPEDGPGMPPADEVEAFLASDEWVDLHRCFDEQIVTGHGTGLKVVAPLAGFAWRDESPGGDQSMLWHALAVGAPEESVREANRRRLLDYNEDDVRATLALRQWLHGHADALPSVGEGIA